MASVSGNVASTSENVASSPQNVNSKRLNQHIGAMIISLGGFTLGVSLGWNSSAGDTLRNVLNASGTQIGLVGSILNVGACGGVTILPWLLTFLGRTTSMLLCLPISIIGWILICLAGQKISFYIIGRILCGIAGGVFCVLTPIYIGEITDKNTRVRLLTYFQLFINLGVFYAFLVAYLLNDHEKIWLYSLICGISCIPIALIYFLPESPLHLLTKNNETRAAQSLRWFRGENYKNQDEMEELKRLAKTKSLNLQTLKNPRVLCTIAVCHGIIITQQFSGINTIIFNAGLIFDSGGSGSLTGRELTLVVGIIQIVASLWSIFLINYLGRRVLLALSGTMMAISMILFGWYSNVRDSDPELYDDTYGWMPPTWISLYFAAYSIGLGPISWSILGDLLPNNIKILGATYLTFISWLLSLITTLTFNGMIVSIGGPKMMWMFAGFCLFGATFCGYFVKNTKGKSLADIQDDFKIDQTMS